MMRLSGRIMSIGVQAELEDKKTSLGYFATPAGGNERQLAARLMFARPR